MKSDVILMGAGGHAKVVIELLHDMGECVAFCVGEADSADTCLGVAVIKGDNHLERLRDDGYHRCFVAVGANTTRQKLATLATGIGYRLVTAVSPNAVISPTARIGQGVAIMAGAIVNADALVGDLVILNTNSSIDHDCRIASATHIGPSCALAGGVRIGERAFLGIGCSVMPCVAIGSDVTVGAGAVVISDIPAGATAVGVPARILSRE